MHAWHGPCGWSYPARRGTSIKDGSLHQGVAIRSRGHSNRWHDLEDPVMAHQAPEISTAPATPAYARCWCGEAAAPHHPSLCERHSYFEAAWGDDAARWRRGHAA
jgi:hypothetical protein